MNNFRKLVKSWFKLFIIIELILILFLVIVKNDCSIESIILSGRIAIFTSVTFMIFVTAIIDAVNQINENHK